MNRRKFLLLSGATAATLLLPQCASNPLTQTFLGNPNRHRSQGFKSEDGLLKIALEARSDIIQVAGRSANLFSYNGQIPGPRIEAKPGDTLQIQFKNSLSESTNLHYHGLHIPPTGNADNIFLEIPSGESFFYEFTIPKNHPSATFWYHPHLHGSTAEQLFAGLAGLLIIRGELDQIPEIQAAQEEFLVLQDFALSQAGERLPLSHRAQMLGREGNVITINGQRNSQFSISSGGLLRLRIANASPARFYRLKLENHPFYLIATESGALEKPIKLDELLLVPGERAEVLIQGNQNPGNYQLLNLPYNRGGMGMMGGGMMRSGNRMAGMMGNPNNTDTTETLAIFTYQGNGKNIALPKTLIPIQKLPNPEKIQRLTLQHGMMPGQGMVFAMNGKTFDHHRIDTQVKLNTIEDWEIVNGDMMDHPFHLHTNHFQVIERNGEPAPYLAWKDTVLVPFGGIVRLRIRFADFAGKSVYHCHILDHEDLGMMGTVEIEET
jgi:FtsP/CotA-like multicopper oxidase with cupredoxin domain